MIAVKNVRLFSEPQLRTADLTRSVDRLMALSEVGHSVSSTLDLETVLQTIAYRAVTISGAVDPLGRLPTIPAWTATGSC
jgi:hypothetical protein